MKKNNVLRYAMLLVLLVLPLGCKQKGIERGRDPWVFRSVLDLNPRMVTVALHKDLWAAYDAEHGSIYRLWKEGVNFDGPVYTQNHGPQPTSVGPAYFVSENRMPWALKKGGEITKPKVQYKGHRFQNEQVALRYELAGADGKVVTVREIPEYVEKEGKVGFERTWETENVPQGTTVVLDVALNSLAAANSFETDGKFEALPNNEKMTNAVSGRLLLNSNAKTKLTAWLAAEPKVYAAVKKDSSGVKHPAVVLMEKTDCYTCHNESVQTVGPAFRAIAEKYKFTNTSVNALVGKVVKGGAGVWGESAMTPHPNLPQEDVKAMIAYIMGLDGEELHEDPLDKGQTYPLMKSVPNPKNEGLAVNIYRFQSLSDYPELSDQDAPVYAGVVPTVHATTPDDFGNLDENFYAEFTGFINIPESSNYVFRTISDDGSELFIEGKKVVDNGGLHGPDPKDGEVQLKQGRYPIRLRFFQGGGGKAVSLQWIRHGEEAFSVIPSALLSYDPKDLKKTKPYVEPEPVIIGRPGDAAPLLEVHPGFTLETIRPKDFKPMVGGLDVAPDGAVYVSTWDEIGGVYKLENVNNGNPENIKVTLIASGLAEPLGLKVVNGEVYVLQKHELTKLIDHDKDGITDEYLTVSNNWKVSPNFHEFAFGLVYKEGFFYATFATAILPGGASANPQIPDRGKVAKINAKDGSVEFVASGLRTPNGIGIGVDGEMFVADNQGDWLPSSKILHVKKGAFFGSRSVDFEGTANTPVMQPVVWLPQDEIGNSPSQPLKLESGPYKGQMMHGEVTHGGLKRVFVEKVDGEYQGVVFRFIQGLEAGVNRAILGPDGKYYVGGIGNPGNWGQTGKLWYGLQRLSYNGKSAFEMLAVRAKTNGMEIEFTEPLGLNDGFDPAEYLVQQWWYKPTIEYGGPKMDLQTMKVGRIAVSEDRKKVFLEVPGLKPQHVVYIRLMRPWVSQKGNSLWSTEAWYTLNRIPQNTPGFTSSVAGEIRQPNTLTTVEKAAGWQMLFDGKTTNGWRTYGKQSIGSAWKAVEGTLALGGTKSDWQTQDGGDIVTNEEYENFELNLEWKISEGGNSGIMYLVVEDAKYKYPWLTGPEMQVLDIVKHPDGRIPKHRAGDLYDLIASPFYPTKPVGEWNFVRIVLNKGKLEHWLNGIKVVSTTLWTPEWNTLVKGSKFIEMPDFAKSKKGRIALQDHGDPVWFRNIKIKRL